MRLGMRREILGDAVVESDNLPLDVAHVVETALDDEAMVVGEVAIQCTLNLLDLGRQPPVGQPDDLGEIQRLAREQRLEETLAGGPEHIAEH